jgi:hypothetical protein
MANQAHLEILKNGVKEWNEWRKQNPEIRPDLETANLTKAELSEAHLIVANLSEAHLALANLSKADLRRANLSGADLHAANLSEAKLSRANLVRADLHGANLSVVNLSEANLGGANLSKANFFGANLGEVNFSSTNLIEASFKGANLREVNFGGANVDEADFTNSLMDNTLIANLDLRSAKGLETVRHFGPSSVGIDTIYKSQGRIPEIFLRRAGTPGKFIAYLKSLVVEPIEYYSCFISYSSKDEEFTRKLHRDLQGEGVRCWFAPEDLKIGDRIRPRIDEAIRVHDKLLLVLTESSVRSPWVEKEVETALEKERRQGRTVLFPIRLDNAVMETDEAWASDLRRMRHIGDFRDWKEHDKYKAAFERLMRDLKNSGE